MTGRSRVEPALRGKSPPMRVCVRRFELAATMTVKLGHHPCACAYGGDKHSNRSHHSDLVTTHARVRTAVTGFNFTLDRVHLAAVAGQNSIDRQRIKPNADRLAMAGRSCRWRPKNGNHKPRLGVRPTGRLRRPPEGHQEQSKERR